MADSYQAIYDAVRSRIGGGNIGEAVSDVARNAFDISHSVACVVQEFIAAAHEQRYPSVLYRPTLTLTLDGDQWCALYGPNIKEGVCGFGMTPDAAMQDFNKQWFSTTCTIPNKEKQQ